MNLKNDNAIKIKWWKLNFMRILTKATKPYTKNVLLPIDREHWYRYKFIPENKTTELQLTPTVKKTPNYLFNLFKKIYCCLSKENIYTVHIVVDQNLKKSFLGQHLHSLVSGEPTTNVYTLLSSSSLLSSFYGTSPLSSTIEIKIWSFKVNTLPN